jgi:hypothetical protein
MKNETSQNALLDKFIYLNYFLVLAFLIINLTAGREYRDITSMIFIGIMLPLALFKISMEWKLDNENGTKLASNTLFRMMLIFGVLFAIYFAI